MAFEDIQSHRPYRPDGPGEALADSTHRGIQRPSSPGTRKDFVTGVPCLPRAEPEFIVGSSPLVLAYRAEIADLATRHHLPTMFVCFHVDAGGLLSYGPDLPEMLHHCGQYVARVLAGAKPAEMPVERPTKFELVINLKTAKALGLTIPPSLLQTTGQAGRRRSSEGAAHLHSSAAP